MRRAIRPLLLALVMCGSVLASASPAEACRCARSATVEEHLARTDIVFIGRVLDSQPAPGLSHGMATRFEVVETLKSAPPRIVRVFHSADVCCVCGLNFAPGQRALVFAHLNDDGELGTSSCSAPRFPLEDYRAALRANRP